MIKGTKYLKEPEFKRIKGLLDMGWSTKKVMEIAERSDSLVSCIKKAKDFADYKRQQAEALARSEQKKQTGKTQPAMKQSTLDIVLTLDKNRQELIQIKGILSKMDTSLELIRRRGRVKLN